MLVLGAIAATDVTADHADAEFHPIVAGLEAFPASLCTRLDIAYLVSVDVSLGFGRHHQLRRPALDVMHAHLQIQSTLKRNLG
jgi:hypothetical protein